MKMTLLDMVQDILNDMDSDEVNSIDDTVEAAQVAQIIKTTYFAMMSNKNWPHLRQAISLIPSTDDTRPTHMAVPDDIKELELINYNCVKEGETRKRYREMKWLDPDAFLRRSNGLNTDNPDVIVVTDYSGIDVQVQSNKNPEYYTSFDDVNLIFDSFDEDIEDTLQESKVQALAYIMPQWSTVDGFIPDLPEEAFIALLEEAKSKASLKLKQEADQKAEQESIRQKRWLSRKAWQVKGGIKYPDYGRKRVKPMRHATFSNEGPR